MDPRRRCLLVLAKMALQDGVVREEERQTLEDMAEGLGSAEIDDIVVEAEVADFEDLLGGIEKYEDRFLIALRAYHMANTDAVFDLVEEASFARLVEVFGITDEDRQLIERVGAGTPADGAAAPEPRLMELHRGSSFFDGDF
jgi:hypothetical protein